MAFPTSYKKDADLDAVLVHASMRGQFALAAMGKGLKPDEAFGRAKWFGELARSKKKADMLYKKKVIARVMEMEKGSA